MKSCFASLWGQEGASSCMELFCCLEKAIYHIVGSISGGLLGGINGKKGVGRKSFLLLTLQFDSVLLMCSELYHSSDSSVLFLLSPLHAVVCLPSLAPFLPLCLSCLPPLCRNPGAIRNWSTAGSLRERESLGNLFLFPALIPSPWQGCGHSV